MRLRDAVPEDLPAVTSLLADNHLPTGGVDKDSIGNFAVAESPDGNVVGCGTVEVYGDSGLLRSVAVASSSRSAGIGKALAENRVVWSRARNLSRLYLLTTTAPGFFKRLGFAPTDRASVSPAVRDSAEFRELCPASAVVMELPLDNRSEERR